MYCLFVEKLMTIEIFLSFHLKPLKWVLFYYFQNISRNCHFFTHFDNPKKVKKEDFNPHQVFSTNKQYVRLD